jgi:2-keto-3-deoxy-L-rhamnonate aldolase RhmA
MRKKNPIRKLLNEGKIVVGGIVYSSSPAVVEVAGFSALDFVRIDTEHAWRRDESMEHMIRAACAADIPAILRLDKNDPYLVRKALEIGAQGIVVSNMCSKHEVEEMVQAAKFPPHGIRGYGSLCFSGGWGAQGGEEWVDWSDREILVGIMIEHHEMIDQLDQVLAIDGLDYVVFGPADYSMSLGLRAPQKNHPKVQEALKKTIEVATKHEKPVEIGIREPWEEEAQKYISLGCRMLTVGEDVVVLRSVWRDAAAKVRALSGS